MIRFATLCAVLPLVLPLPLAWGGDHSSRVRYEPRTFLGYACEDDCQRHKHGFRWAEQWAFTDARLCGPLGHLEAQGCRAYVDLEFDPEAAGERWAIENEVVDPSLCNGAGERFLAGCLDAAKMPPVSRP